MLVRNIHLGIVNRVYDGIASSSWENGMDVKFVFTMPTGNLECIHLWNVCMKTGRRYLDWMPNSGSVSRRIVMEKALIFYPIYWRWRCGVRWKVHVIRGADTMYNSRSSAETEVIASNFIRPQTMIAVKDVALTKLQISGECHSIKGV